MWAGGNLGVVADVSTINVGASTFVDTKPAGYTGWDGTGAAPSSLLQSAVAIM
jgi:hypothetical protein